MLVFNSMMAQGLVWRTEEFTSDRSWKPLLSMKKEQHFGNITQMQRQPASGQYHLLRSS
jgi:hypothetical protein